MKKIYVYVKKTGILLHTLLVLYLINPYNMGFLAGYLIFVLIYVQKEFLLKNIDRDFFLILLFSLVYAAFYFFDMKQGIQWLLIYALFPSTFYLLGKKLIPNNTTPTIIFYLLFILGFIYSITGLTSVSINLIDGGFIQAGRSIPNFWTGKEVLATGMGAFFIFNMCIPGIIIVAKKKMPLWFKSIALGVFIISLLCIFRLGSRTQISLVFLSILLAMVYLFKSQNILTNFKMLFVIILLIFIGFNYLEVDLKADYLSSLGERLQNSDNAGSAGGRTGRWEKSLVNLFKKPLGWDVKEFGYSHNMWFDAARNGSVISFVLLLIFSIKSVKNINRALIVDKTSKLFSYTVIIYNVVIFSQLFMEPALESLFILFIFFCFIQGVLNQYVSLAKSITKKQLSNYNKS